MVSHVSSMSYLTFFKGFIAVYSVFVLIIGDNEETFHFFKILSCKSGIYLFIVLTRPIRRDRFDSELNVSYHFRINY